MKNIALFLPVSEDCEVLSVLQETQSWGGISPNTGYGQAHWGT